MLTSCFLFLRCGNVASILELDDNLGQEYKVFQHAPSVCSAIPISTSLYVPSDSFDNIPLTLCDSHLAT
jgi:hypothetical protein